MQPALLVPVPPGGSVDLLVRLIAEHLPRTLQQTVVVENRPGASGLIAAGFAERVLGWHGHPQAPSRRAVQNAHAQPRKASSGSAARRPNLNPLSLPRGGAGVSSPGICG